MKQENIQENYQDDNLFEERKFVADPKQSPIRLDHFLVDRLEKVSRNQIQEAIHAGAVKVNNKEVKPNFKIKPGHSVSVFIPRQYTENQEIIPEDIPLDIRYEDEDVMIIHKPAGLVVHPGVGNYTGTLVNGLVYYFKQSQLDLPVKEGNEPDRAGLVHRIDKDTTGLMVIAKNRESMTHLGKQFFNHTIKRTYQTIVWGEPEEEEGTIEGHIGRSTRNRILRTVYPEGEEGKAAITHYKVLERMYYISLVECRLETGRTHQIRVHMKYMGHPVFSDERYGGQKVVKGTVFTKYRLFVENCFKLCPRQALHAKSIGFVHPRTGEEMYFECDLPDDMQQVLERWRVYLNGRKGHL